MSKIWWWGGKVNTTVNIQDVYMYLQFPELQYTAATITVPLSLKNLAKIAEAAAKRAEVEL